VAVAAAHFQALLAREAVAAVATEGIKPQRLPQAQQILVVAAVAQDTTKHQIKAAQQAALVLSSSNT
jgi:hypothetical protein